MKLTYLFYDIESSGLNKCFDQVLQFAAIRTDLDLNELDRYEIHIKPNRDLFPHPQAVITHHIAPVNTPNAVTEVEGIAQIHALMNVPGTISLGYNTLTFDDEFLRFSFYRNLLPPYTHQYANQCKRMDIYPMLTFFHLYKSDVLPHWPLINGQISLKLEKLSEANQLAVGRAHDAMVDVEATVALTRYLMKAKPMWDYLCGYFDKATDQKRCQDLPITMESPKIRHHEGLMVWGKIGTKHGYQAPVLSMGPHLHYTNQTLWLRLDLPELREATLDNVDEKVWVFAKKMAEPGFLLPANPERMAKLKMGRQEEIRKNKQWIQDHPVIFEGMMDYFQHRKYPEFPGADVDSALYQKPFWTSEEARLCKQFHQASPQAKGAMIERFHNIDLQNMAIRIVGRHYPEYLPEAYRAKFQSYLNQVLSDSIDSLPADFKGEKRLGYPQVMQVLTELENKSGLTVDQKELIAALAGYYHKLLQQRVLS